MNKELLNSVLISLGFSIAAYSTQLINGLITICVSVISAVLIIFARIFTMKLIKKYKPKWLLLLTKKEL